MWFVTFTICTEVPHGVRSREYQRLYPTDAFSIQSAPRKDDALSIFVAISLLRSGYVCQPSAAFAGGQCLLDTIPRNGYLSKRPVIMHCFQARWETTMKTHWLRGREVLTSATGRRFAHSLRGSRRARWRKTQTSTSARRPTCWRGTASMADTLVGKGHRR
jgi:hypothetical protein